MIYTVQTSFWDLSRLYLSLHEEFANQKTLERNKLDLRLFVYPIICRQGIDQINGTHIELVRQGVVHSHDSNRVREVLLMLRRIFDLACDMGILDENPCNTVRTPKWQDKGMKLFTEEEMKRILEAVSHNYMKNYYGLILTAGIKTRAMATLHRRDYDSEKKQLTIEENGQKRKIRLSELSCDLIESEMKRQDRLREKAGDSWRNQENDYLFTDYTGQMLQPFKVSCNNRLIQEHSGVLDFCPKNLRIQCIMQSIIKGNNPTDVILYSGLTSPDTTSRYVKYAKYYLVEPN